MKKTFTPQQKAAVALAAIRGDTTINQISGAYEVHPTQAQSWKKIAQENLPALFADKRKTVRRRLLFIGGGFAVLALLFAVSFWFAGSGSDGGTVSVLSGALAADDWKRGNENAKVVLIEYSDFQCPACASYYPLVKALHDEFSDSLLVVYRHFPLSQIHTNADPAARAAEAAGKQGKFWEMHDLLFERQKEWSSDRNASGTFAAYAGMLGLDTNRFISDFNSPEVIERVRSDYQGGFRAGIAGTPTFFLNGKKIQNPRSYDEFKKIISETAQ